MVGLAVAGLATGMLRGLGTDVGWSVYVANSLFGGARLYRDIIEINPPLFIWIMMPVLAAMRAFGISEIAIAPLVLICVQVTVALALSWQVLKCATDLSIVQRYTVLLSAMAVLGVLAGADFAQREHQATILLLPYCIAAARTPHRRLPARLWGPIGAMAGVAMSFKPHFVVAGIVFEVLVALWVHRAWRLKPDTVAAACAVSAYVACVLLFTPEYIPLVREWGGLYLDYINAPIAEMLLTAPSLFVLLAGALSLAASNDSAVGRLRRVLAIAAWVMLAAAVLQRKGWFYHFYPALAFAMMSVTLLLSDRKSLGRFTGRQRIGTRVAVSCVLGLGLAVVLLRGAVAAVSIKEERQRVATVGAMLRAQSVMPQTAVVVSIDLAVAHPLLVYTELESLYSHPSMWMLRRLCRFDSPILATQDRTFNPIRTAITSMPDLLIVDERAKAARLNDVCGGVLSFIAHDPVIARVLESYELIGEAEGLVLYRHKFAGSSGSKPL